MRLLMKVIRLGQVIAAQYAVKLIYLFGNIEMHRFQIVILENCQQHTKNERKKERMNIILFGLIVRASFQKYSFVYIP